jgi:type III pantothenate kinase
MQSGITYGYASLVEGMIERIRNEVGFPCAILATGGLAPLIAKLTSCIEHVDDSLALRGMRIVYERNRPT